MSQPKAAPQWVRKPAAAEFLGVSERQIERHVSAGRLRWRRLPRQKHETQSPVEFRVADLRAIRAGKPNYYPQVQTAGVAPLSLSAIGSEAVLPAAPEHGSAPALSAVENLLRMLLERTPEPAALAAPATAEKPQEAPPAPWLTPRQGAQMLKLPLSKVREMMAAGEVAVVKVGSAFGRPMLRVSRDDLLAWRPQAQPVDLGPSVDEAIEAMNTVLPPRTTQAGS